jgi:hypothetical protein
MPKETKLQISFDDSFFQQIQTLSEQLGITPTQWIINACFCQLSQSDLPPSLNLSSDSFDLQLLNTFIDCKIQLGFSKLEQNLTEQIHLLQGRTNELKHENLNLLTLLEQQEQEIHECQQLLEQLSINPVQPPSSTDLLHSHDLSHLTIRQLWAIATELGISHYKKYKKADLIAQIQQQRQLLQDLDNGELKQSPCL